MKTAELKVLPVSVLKPAAYNPRNHNTQRYKIEDCFRVLKTNFAARPVYHQKKEYIIANFMICYTALLLYRLLDKKCYQPKELNKKLKKILG